MLWKILFLYVAGILLLIIFIIFFIIYRCPNCGASFFFYKRNLMFFRTEYCPKCEYSLDGRPNPEKIESVDKFEIKKNYVKECPYCNKNISIESIFCQFCGNKINVCEEKVIIEKQQVLDKKGIAQIFKNEELLKHANDIRRIYGKATYISYLKNKAKELGLGEIEIDED